MQPSQATRAAYAVVRVRLSVRCPSHSCIVSKRVNLFSNILYRRIATFYFFHTKPCDNVSTGTLLTGSSNAGRYEKNRDFRPISRFEMTGGVSSAVSEFRPSSMLITASVAFVYISRRIRRIEQNIIYLYALVTLKLK